MRNLFLIISLLLFAFALKGQTPLFNDWMMSGYSTAQGVMWISYQQDGDKAIIQLMDANLGRRSSFQVGLDAGMRFRYCYFLYDTYLNDDKLFEMGLSVETAEGENKVLIYNEIGHFLKEFNGVLSVGLWPATGYINTPGMLKSDVKLQVTEFVNGIPIHNLHPLPLSNSSAAISVSRGEILTLYPDSLNTVELPLPSNMPIGECNLYIFDSEKRLVKQFPVRRGARAFKIDAGDFSDSGIYYYDVTGIRNGFTIKDLTVSPTETY